MDGGGGWYGCVGGCPMHACTHTHAHACTHAHTCMLNMLNMLNMDASMSAAICNFYTCINVCVCMCMLSGYHADTPITIKAEPFIWPTAALINIHEHPI